jgi:hypothetical protein
MNIGLKRILRDEKGAALIVALILMLVGGLIAAPLLDYMGTGLVTGEVYETRTAELYAADAGVENALWKINDGEVVLCPGDPTHNYTIPDVNGKTVDITITSIDAYEGIGNLTGTYQIVSTATGDDSGTEIEVYVGGASKYGDYSGMMDHIITINDDLTEDEIEDLYKELAKVVLTCPEGCTESCCLIIYDYYAPPEGCEGCGVVYNYPDPSWPPPEILSGWYLEDVEDATHYYGDMNVDLAGLDDEIGPLYVEGELTIKNSITADPEPTLSLDGTLYVTGDTLIGSTDKDFVLDLNGHTLFIASTTAGSQKALTVGGKCTIDGPGIIISVGDVYFGPKGDVGSVTEPVFLFSVSVTAQLQPSNNWYGAIAGSVDVVVQPGLNPTITYPPGGFGVLNFPGMTAPRLGYSIESWEVTQQ